MNHDLLLTIEEYNLYVPHSTFFHQVAGGSVFGFMRVWACWLTQHFYYPWLGSAILIGMLTVSTCLLMYACGLRRLWALLLLVPSCLIVWNIVGIGYRLYNINTLGYLMLPAVQLLAVSIIAAVLSALLEHFTRPIPNIRRIAMTALTLVCCCVILFPLHFGKPDRQFARELSMKRALAELRYNDVIQQFTQDKSGDEPTTLMVLYKNIALMHTGRLTEMFSTGNCGTMPTSADTTSINRMAGAEIYYQLGEYNYAYRLSIEYAVKYGLTVARVKMLARCAIMNLEMDLAYKYLTLLRRSPYHRSWALEHDQMLREFTPLVQSKEYQAIHPFCSDAPNILDTDGGLCLRYILDSYSSLITQNPDLEDMAMCCALWNKDDGNFMYHFANYVNRRNGNIVLPQLYQEAAYMLAADKNCPYDLSQIQFDNINIVQRYLRFVSLYSNLKYKGADDETIARELRPEFGHTYWYYFFCFNDFKIY